jgi:hypothetical protein
LAHAEVNILVSTRVFLYNVVAQASRSILWGERKGIHTFFTTGAPMTSSSAQHNVPSYHHTEPVDSMATNTEIAKPEERFSIEEVGSDGHAKASQKGATARDEAEMNRMGKAQELRVSA